MPMFHGCADVAYRHGDARPQDRSLVFGRMLLVRDGVSSAISTFSTAVRIDKITSTDEPPMVVHPFTDEGRFYWLLEPGQYRLTMPLHLTDVFEFTFSVPKMPGTYYFGDLLFKGTMHFHTLGGANIKDVTAVFEDHFDAEMAELLTHEPQLAGDHFGKLNIVDMSQDMARQRALRLVLANAPLCCSHPSGFQFELLAFDMSKTYEIDAEQGAYDFGGAKSYFGAFALPPYTAPYVIFLRSQAMSSGVPGQYRVFSPAAMLLDEQFNVIERIETGLAQPAPASLVPPRPVSMYGQIEMSELRARARYLVLYTTHDLLGSTRSATMPGTMLIPGGALPLGMPMWVGMDPWITGRVTISLNRN
ncbi:MAG: MalM family protein [Pseudomonadota bacterium]